MTPRSDNEAGSTLIIAMIVMMVLSSLSLAVLGRTLSVLHFVRNGQDYDAGLAAADSGLSDALFKIDQTAPASFKQSGTSGQGTFQYWAVKQDPSTYVVTSLGAVGVAKHGIQARVSRSAYFPYALFSRQQLSLDGTTAIGGTHISFSLFNAPSGTTDRVRIGSNSTVVCNGTPDPNIYIDWYSTQSDCASTLVTKLAKPRDISIKEPPLTPRQACPTNGTFGVGSSTAALPFVIDGLGGVPFVCTQDVTFTGFISVVNGPVKIYVEPSTDTNGVVTQHTVDISNAIINTAGSATQFQLFKEGPVPMIVNSNTSSTLTFRGVLFAPDTPLTINGGVWWAGSINVFQLNVNGSPNIKILYDNDLNTYLGPDWTVARYREIPSSEAPVPGL